MLRVPEQIIGAKELVGFFTVIPQFVLCSAKPNAIAS